MGKVIYRPFCFGVQQEMLQVSKDMMTTAMLAGLIFPAMFMKEKKKSKTNPNIFKFLFEYTDWLKHRHSLYQSYCYKNCTLQTV